MMYVKNKKKMRDKAVKKAMEGRGKKIQKKTKKPASKSTY